MVSMDPEDERSPLDQIRHVEAEVTRRIAAERESAAAVVANAKAHAKVVLKEARERGQREGQSKYKEIILKAEEEAQVLVAQAHYEADALRYMGERMMRTAVAQAIFLITSVEGEHHSNEP